MNRSLRVSLMILSFAVAIGVARDARAQVHVDVNIGVPPPPAVVFPSPPQPVVIPQSQVYYVPGTADYDLYRYGSYWYVNREGYWYRSHAYGGPFTYVGYKHVPHQVFVVPAEYRHHPAHPHGHGHHKHDDH